MAINLGEINFGLGPDTRRLRTAVQDIVRFGQAVNQAASQTARGMSAAEAALRRQEIAAIKAFQQTKALQDTMARAGLTAQQQARLLNTTTGALNLYTQTLTRGQLSTNDMVRATQRFNLTMQQNRLALKAFTEEAQAATRSNFIGFLQRVAQTSVLIAGPLSGAAARLTTFASIATHVGVRLAVMAAGVAGAVAAFGFLTKAIINVQKRYQGLLLTLESVSGSQELANEDLARVRDVANKTGGSVDDLARAYARMQAASVGTNLEGGRTWKIFQQIAFASAKLGASTEDTIGVFRAIEQIMSKGVVQAEELRGQLGDRLPGAFQIMAEALGVTTAELNKMMKQGVITADALVAFSDTVANRLGVDTSQAIDTVVAAQTRLSNAWDSLMLKTDESTGITSAYTSVLDGLTAVMYGLSLEIQAGSKWVSGWTAEVWKAVRAGAEWAGIVDDIHVNSAQASFANRDYGWADMMGTEAQMKRALKFKDEMMGWGDYVNRNKRQLAVALTALDPLGGKGNKGDTAAEIDRRAKAIREANQTLMEMAGTYKQLFMTPAAAEWANIQQDINKQTQDFADKLKDAGVSADVASQLVAKYQLSLQLLKETEYNAAHTVTVMELLSDAFQQAGTQAVDAFVDALFSGKDAMAALADVAKQTAASILKSMLQLAVINPLLNSIFGLALPGLGGLGGTGAVAGAPMNLVPALHKGTSFAHAGAGPLRAVSAAAFAGAPRLHSGTGVGSGEFAAILQEGEQVIPRGGRGGGGGRMIVNINNYSAERVQEERTRVGQDEIVNIIVGKVMSGFGTGKADGVLRSRYGLQPSQRRAFK